MDVSATCEARLVSSRKLQAGTSLGDEGRASETRLLAVADAAAEAGKGAVNEKVDVVDMRCRRGADEGSNNIPNTFKFTLCLTRI